MISTKNIFSKIIIISLLLFGFYANAQKISVSGTVVEVNSNQKLEYATVILKPVDKSTVTGGITNLKGNFDIQIKKGTYQVLVEFISFKTKD